jgi:hypothetical protein
MTMKQFEASARIEASPETVWSILADVGSYPEWDPSCERIEGALELGGRLRAFSKLSPGRAFPLRVTELEPPRRMVWSGGMPLGLFRGVRTFTATEAPGGATDFSLREVFSGPMLALIGRSIPDMTDAFEGFCAGLKQRAEGRGE